MPETDADLKITDFAIFNEEEKYHVDYDIPHEFGSKTYHLGDGVPIPFWIESKLHFVLGDAEANDIARDYGQKSTQHPVLVDLKKLLADARSGLFREQEERWIATEIATNYSDIFHETPVHSRYWVSRFGDAVRYARSITKPPHRVDDDIRRVALEWIERFATKTDLERLLSVIGTLRDGAITSDRAQAMLFAYLTNKLQTNKFSEIENKVRSDKNIAELFPDGIYHYWWKNRWPVLTFKYSRPYDLLDPLATCIRDGKARNDFRRAERMAYLYFRRDDAPRQIKDLVNPILDKTWKKLDKQISRSRDIFENHRSKPMWQDEARKILFTYYTMMALDGILNGTLRLSRAIIDRRFGLDNYYVKDLEEKANLYTSEKDDWLSA